MRIPAAIRSLRHYEAVRGAALATLNRARQPLRGQRKLLADYLRRHPTAKLNIGCGNNLLHGWLNTEYSAPLRPGVLFLEARRPFPMPDASFDYVFSEHMIEHVTYTQGQHVLHECFRVLRPGGRIRIATPSLDRLRELYADRSDLQQRYIEWSVDTFQPHADAYLPGFVVNNMFWNFEHRFVYDAETLRHALTRAGFIDIREYPVGESDDPELRGRERHMRRAAEFNAYETLVLEGRRP